MRRQAVELARRRQSGLAGVVAHHEPGQCRQQQRKAAERDEHAAPVGEIQHPHERRPRQHRAQVSDQHGQAGQGAEMAFAKPQRVDLEDREEHRRHPQPHQQPAERRHRQRVGEREQDRTRPRDDPTQGDDAAHPEGIDQHAARHLHQRVDIEVRGGQRTQRRPARRKGALQLAGNRGRRHAMEERQHIGQPHQHERRPAQALQTGTLRRGQHVRRGFTPRARHHR